MKPALPILLLAAALSFGSATLDTFGLQKFYPTKAGTVEWNSAHWNNGIPRNFSYDTDPYDPTGWTDDHSVGSEGFKVDGNGVLWMGGAGPRFHINSLSTSKGTTQFFRDVEFTAYSLHRGTGGPNYGGMVIGVRSDPLGHSSAGGDNCNATTYYARFRNDATWDFEKELYHPSSGVISGSRMWGSETRLPTERWIGMKFLVYNIDNDASVKLELYVDSVSGGVAANAVWEKVGETIDAGSWAAGNVGSCGYLNTMINLQGHGTMLMRTDNDTALYKMVSVREIDVSGGATALGPVAPLPLLDANDYAVYDLQGQLLFRGVLPAGASTPAVRYPAPGVFFLRIGAGYGSKTLKVVIR